MKKSFKPRRNEEGSDKSRARKTGSQDKPTTRSRRGSTDRNQDDKPASFKTRRSNFNNFDNPRFINDKDSVSKQGGWDDFDTPSERKRPSRNNDDRPKRAFSRDGDDRPKRSFSSDNDEKPKRSYSRDNDDRPKRTFSRDGDDKPKRSFSRDNDDRPKRSFSSDNDEKPKRNFSRDNDGRPKRSFSSDNDEKPKRSYSRDNDDRPKRAFSRDGDDRPKRSYNKSDKSESTKGYSAGREEARPKKSKRGTFTENGAIRLNRYISMAGICSRREADEMITAGVVSVNGKVVTELGSKVEPGDDIRYNGERLKNETHRYILLNKPKDYITTMEDPTARKTVMELISGACRERVYPVGRLDRLTTGLLLFTNDGDLAKVLTHPSSLVRKIYHVELSKNVKASDLKLIAEGIQLDDGFMQVDQVAYDGDGTDKKMVGLQIHSGKNRIVRRIFEHLGYEVVKLDRVMFAGLTKKDLPRGRFRSLSETEVGMLKMISPKRMKGVR